ncbi:hypothetical protein HanIR_Chr16g0845541 [Helianthus annuus]|nr:hypothetical protein HanIR_Chr16g0845541 [Helianthus annuus]
MAVCLMNPLSYSLHFLVHIRTTHSPRNPFPAKILLLLNNKKSMCFLQIERSEERACYLVFLFSRLYNPVIQKILLHE